MRHTRRQQGVVQPNRQARRHPSTRGHSKHWGPLYVPWHVYRNGKHVGVGTYVTVAHTKPRPWVTRSKRRAVGKRAHDARRVNLT